MDQVVSQFDFVSIIWIAAAYLLGSVSFGILISKCFGLADPRTVGSGNPGATNVLRSGKKSAAALTLLGDMLKGWLPVWLCATYATGSAWLVVAVGLAVFLGHLYPIYHGFKGGKGVATALGVMLGVSGCLGLSVFAVWVLTFAVSRISSLSALVAAVAAPLIAFYLFKETTQPYVWMLLVMTVFLVWRHRTNIQKLLDGTESGFKKK